MIVYSSKKTSSVISYKVTAKKLVRLCRGVYTDNVESPAEDARKFAFDIARRLFPKDYLSHRTAVEFKPELIVVSGPKYGIVRLPGVNIYRVKAVKHPRTQPFAGYRSSVYEQALLESLTRHRGKFSGVGMTDAEMETVIRNRGGRLDMERIRHVAKKTQLARECGRLERMIGSARFVESDASSSGYDQPLLVKLARMAGEMNSRSQEQVKQVEISGTALLGYAFSEAFFSNFVEGTEFEVEEAVEIIRGRRAGVSRRLDDSRDIKQAYDYILSKNPAPVPSKMSYKEFELLLKESHAAWLGHRKEVRAGQFKDVNNRSGAVVFTDKEQVGDTLKAGFELSKTVLHPWHRAVYLHVLLTQVHPFLDGNGRVSRLITNFELRSASLTPLVVTPRNRDYYLKILREFHTDPPSPGLADSLLDRMKSVFRIGEELPFDNFELLLRRIRMDVPLGDGTFPSK